MKKILSFVMAGLASLQLYAQEPPTYCNKTTGCAPIGDPVITTCFGDIEKVLARSMDMAGLAKINSKTFWPDGSGGTFNCNDPFATASFYGFPADLKCDIGGYNPTRYCMDIEYATSLGATMLLNVANLWGSDDQYYTGSPYMQAAAQAVIDINNRYDCAGRRRPVIGAAITEWVDPSVNTVVIPAATIDAFQAEIALDPAMVTYYATHNLFNINNICAIGGNTPDISKLEARMYFYHLACKYIDMGYKEITPDFISNCVLRLGSDPTGANTYNVLSKVRAYAASKNSLLIIPSYLPASNFYYNGNLLFDFRYSAVRPQEIYAPGGSPAGEMCSSTFADNNNEAAYYVSSGTSPYANCNYSGGGNEQRIPFLTSIDWHSGTCNGGPGGPITNYNGSGDRWCVWGYDEARFFNSLSNSCQADWADYVYETMRGISHRGFFSMPGRLVCKNGDQPADPSYPTWVNGAYRLANNSTLYSRIANDIWHVNQSPSFTLTPLGCLFGMNAYLVTVNNPEQSTVYTWHVQNPNGSWQPYTYGTSRIIFPILGSGTYTIGLRCDNWGYTSSATGVLTSQQTPFLVQYFCRTASNDDKKNQAHMEEMVNNAKDISEVNDILKRYDIDTTTKAMSVSYLQDNGNLKDIQVYPNPASNKVTISLPKENGTELSVTIYNSTGQLMNTIQTATNNSATDIDVSYLPAGVYALKIKTEKTSCTRNITVIR